MNAADHAADTVELLDALEAIRGVTLFVLGDYLADEYLLCESGARENPESDSAPLLKLASRERRPGGAGAVCLMAKALGANVVALGSIGRELPPDALRQCLKRACIDVGYLEADRSNHVPVKTRVYSRDHAQGGGWLYHARIDAERAGTIGEMAEASVCESIQDAMSGRCDHAALAIADYAKGVCSGPVVDAAMRAAGRHGIPVLVDPPRGGDWLKYRGADVLKCNRSEWGEWLRRSTAEGIAAPGRHQVVTSGGAGMFLDDEFIPGEAVENPADVSGAGDMVLAVLGVCVAAGVDLRVACSLANVAAAAKVRRTGAVPVRRGELFGLLESQP